MRHLTLPQLSASIDEALSGVSLELVRRHLESCEECRTRQAKLARVDGLLAQLITHDPGEEWHAAAAEEIAEHIAGEAAGIAAQPRRRAGPPPWQTLGERWTGPEPVIAPARSSASEPLGSPAAPEAKRVTTPSPATPTARTAAPKSPPERLAPVAAPALAPAPRDAEPTRASAPQADAHPARVASPQPAQANRRDPIAVHRARVQRTEAPGTRETVLPMAAGLIGGAIAGAIIVGLMFSPRLGARRPAEFPGSTRSGSLARPADPGFLPASGEPRGPEITSARPPASPEIPADSEVSGLETRGGEPVAPSVHVPARTAPKPAPKPSPEPARRVPGPATAVDPRTPPAAAPQKPTGSAPMGVPNDDEVWPFLCGIVVADRGEPIAGARVLLADLDIGVRTDRNGRFCVSAPVGDRTLTAAALGFVTQRWIVTLVAGGSDVRLVLKAAP